MRLEQADVPDGMKAGDLAGFMLDRDIPATAELGTVEQYGNVTIVLTWLVDDD